MNPVFRLLDRWLFRPDDRPGGGLKHSDLPEAQPKIAASSSAYWTVDPPPDTRWQCPQCLTNWPRKPRVRSHPFPKDHRSPAWPSGEGVTVFLRCPGRPVRVTTTKKDPR